MRYEIDFYGFIPDSIHTFNPTDSQKVIFSDVRWNSKSFTPIQIPQFLLSHDLHLVNINLYFIVWILRACYQSIVQLYA